MSNPLYTSLNNGNQFAKVIAEFNQFKNTFKGNPKDEVMRLLSSGQMSQSQFNQLQSMAQMLQNLMR